MLKNRIAVRKACLLAGVDSTLPLRVVDINRGWKPEQLDQLVEADPINSLISPMVQTDGAKYDEA
jgi:hypothetical protein